MSPTEPGRDRAPRTAGLAGTGLAGTGLAGTGLLDAERDDYELAGPQLAGQEHADRQRVGNRRGDGSVAEDGAVDAGLGVATFHGRKKKSSSATSAWSKTKRGGGPVAGGSWSCWP